MLAVFYSTLMFRSVELEPVMNGLIMIIGSFSLFCLLHPSRRTAYIQSWLDQTNANLRRDREWKDANSEENVQRQEDANKPVRMRDLPYLWN